MPGPSFDDHPHFRLSAQLLGSEAAVALSGELDIAGAPALARVLADAATERCRRVVIDARGLTFLDAAGLRALCSAPPGVEVVLRCPSLPARRVLDLASSRGLIRSAVVWSASDVSYVLASSSCGAVE